MPQAVAVAIIGLQQKGVVRHWLITKTSINHNMLNPDFIRTAEPVPEQLPRVTRAGN